MSQSWKMNLRRSRSYKKAIASASLLLVSALFLFSPAAGDENFDILEELNRLSQTIKAKKFRSSLDTIQVSMEELGRLYIDQMKSLFPSTPKGWSLVEDEWSWNNGLDVKRTYEKSRREQVKIFFNEYSSTKDIPTVKWMMEYIDDAAPLIEKHEVDGFQGLLDYKSFGDSRRGRLSFILGGETALLSLEADGVEKEILTGTFGDRFPLREIDSLLYFYGQPDLGEDPDFIVQRMRTDFAAKKYGNLLGMLSQFSRRVLDRRYRYVEEVLPDGTENWRFDFGTDDSSLDGGLKIDKFYNGKKGGEIRISLTEQVKPAVIEEINGKLEGSLQPDQGEHVIDLQDRRLLSRERADSVRILAVLG